MISTLEIELCCADIYSVALAAEFHFDGIEICVDLKSGGLTPSYGFFKESRDVFKNEIAVLIRPRKSHFVYSKEEQKIILYDIQHFVDKGADTIVFGCLNEHNKIDSMLFEKIIKVSSGAKICFHRAIDLIEDKHEAILELFEYQVDRILSSGGEQNALAGSSTLRKMLDWSENKIQIMAGGGINSKNVKSIIEQTAVSRIHFSASKSNPPSDSNIINLGEIESSDKEMVKSILNEIR